jgi:hypothetical protein
MPVFLSRFEVREGGKFHGVCTWNRGSTANDLPAGDQFN